MKRAARWSSTSSQQAEDGSTRATGDEHPVRDPRRMPLAAAALGARPDDGGHRRVRLRRGRRRFGRGPTLVVAFVCEGGLLLAGSQAPNLPSLFVLWLLIGLPFGVWMPTARTLQQRLTPPRLLGRVNTTGRMIPRGSMVFGSLLAAATTSTRWPPQ